MTEKIQWNSSFSVGHALLDLQHRKLLGLCNELEDCANANADPFETASRFHAILQELTQYARDHFHTEESLLQQYAYPALAAQKQEHEAFEKKMIDLSFAATMDIFEMEDAKKFLAHWWQNHILVSDMQYKSLMESKR